MGYGKSEQTSIPLLPTLTFLRNPSNINPIRLHLNPRLFKRIFDKTIRNVDVFVVVNDGNDFADMIRAKFRTHQLPLRNVERIQADGQSVAVDQVHQTIRIEHKWPVIISPGMDDGGVHHVVRHIAIFAPVVVSVF